MRVQLSIYYNKALDAFLHAIFLSLEKLGNYLIPYSLNHYMQVWISF